jgi:NADH-quinone oxidoreductase subunit M
MDGAVQVYPHVGMAVVLATALNGIAVLKAYFLIFAGRKHATSIPLRGSWRVRTTVLVLAVLILAGGLYPQPGVESRHRAALEVLAERKSPLPAAAPQGTAGPPHARP